MQLRRLQPGQMPSAADWNALVEMAERAFNLTTDPSTGIEVLRAGGGPISLRSSQVPSTPGIDISGWQTIDYNTTPIFGSPITQIDLGVEFANCSISGTTFVIGIFDAGLGITTGLINLAEQKLTGLKVFESGLISGTNQDDGFFYEFSAPNNPGTGYVVGDVLTVVGGTLAIGATATSVSVTAVNGAGGVVAVTVSNPGLYDVVPANSVVTSGGTGAGCTLDVTWLGNKKGKFFLASPAGSSIGSPPYCAWGDWAATIIYQAYANVVSNVWILTVPGTGSNYNGILKVRGSTGGGSTVIAAASAANNGVFGVVDSGGVIHDGQTGPPNGAFTVIGGIVDSLGVPGQGFDVVAIGNLTGQTGAVISVCTFTNVQPDTGTYRISGYITITAVSIDVINLQVTYTDETTTVRTVTLIPMGATLPAVGTVGVFTFPAIDIRAKVATNIVIKTILATGGGSVTYDVGGVIERLS